MARQLPRPPVKRPPDPRVRRSHPGTWPGWSPAEGHKVQNKPAGGRRLGPAGKGRVLPRRPAPGAALQFGRRLWLGGRLCVTPESHGVPAAGKLGVRFPMRPDQLQPSLIGLPEGDAAEPGRQCGPRARAAPSERRGRALQTCCCSPGRAPRRGWVFFAKRPECHARREGPDWGHHGLAFPSQKGFPRWYHFSTYILPLSFPQTTRPNLQTWPRRQLGPGSGLCEKLPLETHENSIEGRCERRGISGRGKGDGRGSDGVRGLLLRRPCPVPTPHFSTHPQPLPGRSPETPPDAPSTRPLLSPLLPVASLLEAWSWPFR